MKKLFALLLALSMVFALAACSDSAEAEDTTPGDPAETAITVGEYDISGAFLNYFYIDAISEYQQTVYEQYYYTFGSYWSLMLGYDTTQKLSEQVFDEDGTTWADYFMDSAINTAKSVYALYGDSVANGYSLSQDEQDSMESNLEYLKMYASYYGFSDTAAYLQANYGPSASEETYNEYYRVCTVASSYLVKYMDELEYTLSDYRAYEADKYNDYTVVSYAYYTMGYSSYLGEGTLSEDGETTVWSDDEMEAARAAMKADAQAILSGKIQSKEDFDKAIQALEINQTDNGSTSAASVEVTDVYFSSIVLHAGAVEWLEESGRTAGDIGAFEIYTYAEHEDEDHEHGDGCGCTRTVDGYTVVLLTGRDEQTTKLVNVRHILVAFEGGSQDTSGNTVYSDEEKAAAKAEAEQLLQQWKDGAATEESFSELANEKSDDQGGQVTNGGIYEDIYPGQMVEPFENWCFDQSREPGDTGLVMTVYGYHVMYFSSTDELSYRDLLIDNDLRNEDTRNWLDGLVEKVSYTEVNLSLIDLDFTTTT